MRSAAGLLAADAVVAAAHLVNLTIIGALYRPLAMLDLDYETNLPTWYATVKLAVIGFMLLLLAWTEIRRRAPGGWALVLPAIIALYLSLDELAQIHERLSRVTGSDLIAFSGGWMLVAAPAFVLAVALCAVLARDYWRPVRGRLLAGTALYLLAAAGLEIPHNFVEANSAAHLALIFVEEMGELVAASIVLWATWDLLAARGIRLVVEPPGGRSERAG